MTVRLIKNLLNLVTLLLFSVYIFMSITVISNNAPYCKDVGEIVMCYTLRLLPAILTYLATTSLLNFLAERFLEKRPDSNGYLKILLISVLTLTFAILLANIDLCGHCENK